MLGTKFGGDNNHPLSFYQGLGHHQQPKIVIKVKSQKQSCHQHHCEIIYSLEQVKDEIFKKSSVAVLCSSVRLKSRSSRCDVSGWINYLFIFRFFETQSKSFSRMQGRWIV